MGNQLSAVISSEHTFEASWKQPEDVDRYLREMMVGRTLNLCCGKSPLGDVQVDADASHDPDVLADMNNLPFQTGVFETVLFDPPWKMGYHQRWKSFYEAVRVTENSGTILYNARWLGESDHTEVTEVVVRADDRWANVSTIAVHEKRKGQKSVADF